MIIIILIFTMSNLQYENRALTKSVKNYKVLQFSGIHCISFILDDKVQWDPQG